MQFIQTRNFPQQQGKLKLHAWRTLCSSTLLLSSLLLAPLAIANNTNSTTATKTSSNSTGLKAHLEKQGYNFVKQIDAPQGMQGWAGFKDEYPSTVFISNDQKYYLVGDLFNAQDQNLTEAAIEQHVKSAVLDQIWNSLQQSTWIKDGADDAARIVYVFNDVNCPYCHTFWQQARPWVESGKVQLRHIMVGVIRPSSKAQAASILNAPNRDELFKQYNQSSGKMKIKEMAKLPQALSDQLDHNAQLMEKYGFYATPALVWKDAKGQIKSQQGAPKDLKAVFE